MWGRKILGFIIDICNLGSVGIRWRITSFRIEKKPVLIEAYIYVDYLGSPARNVSMKMRHPAQQIKKHNIQSKAGLSKPLSVIQQEPEFYI
jgi:hypothetical protein